MKINLGSFKYFETLVLKIELVYNTYKYSIKNLSFLIYEKIKQNFLVGEYTGELIDDCQRQTRENTAKNPMFYHMKTEGVSSVFFFNLPC